MQLFPNQSKRNKSTFGDGSVCLGGNLTIIRIQLILLIVFQIVIVLHIVTQWLHKEYYLNIAALVVLGLYIVVNESGFGMLADNSIKNDSDSCNHHDICYGRSADQKNA